MNLLKGHHITPRNTKDFYQACKELDATFNGAMRLLGIVDKALYQADIVIEKGDVRAASFEAVGGNKILYGEDALASIREHLAGSQGRLDIYRFDEHDMHTALEDNKDSLVDSAIKLSEIGVKIKAIKPKEVITKKAAPQAAQAASDKQHEIRKSRMFGLSKITSMFGGGGPQRPARGDRVKRVVKKPSPQPDAAGGGKMAHVAGFKGNEAGTADARKAERAREIQKNRLDSVIRNPSPDQAADALEAQPRLNQPAQGMMAAAAGAVKGMSSRKRERMEEIQKKRIVTIIKKPQEEAPKVKVKSFDAGEKVETSIDKLYELVQKYKTLKVDDRLARALKVNKTQIEEWAMILEEHNLLELHYPTIGEPIIKYIPRGKG